MTRDILVALVDMLYIYKDRKVNIAFQKMTPICMLWCVQRWLRYAAAQGVYRESIRSSQGFRMGNKNTICIYGSMIYIFLSFND